MKDIISEYELATQIHQDSVNRFLENRRLVREANRDRTAQSEARRRRIQCLVRSLVFEVLPTKVASLIAQPCVPSCASNLAA